MDSGNVVGDERAAGAGINRLHHGTDNGGVSQSQCVAELMKRNSVKIKDPSDCCGSITSSVPIIEVRVATNATSRPANCFRERLEVVSEDIRTSSAINENCPNADIPNVAGSSIRSAKGGAPIDDHAQVCE